MAVDLNTNLAIALGGVNAGFLALVATTFGALPAAPPAGTMAYITDCNTVTWGATAAAGGSNKVQVWFNGTNWTVVGK